MRVILIQIFVLYPQHRKHADLVERSRRHSWAGCRDVCIASCFSAANGPNLPLDEKGAGPELGTGAGRPARGSAEPGFGPSGAPWPLMNWLPGLRPKSARIFPARVQTTGCWEPAAVGVFTDANWRTPASGPPPQSCFHRCPAFQVGLRIKCAVSVKLSAPCFLPVEL